jgi:hypothetical protein
MSIMYLYSKVDHLFTKYAIMMPKFIWVFHKCAVTLSKVLKDFLSISYKSVVILPNFINGIIWIIHNYAVMPPNILKVFLDITNTNAITQLNWNLLCYINI